MKGEKMVPANSMGEIDPARGMAGEDDPVVEPGESHSRRCHVCSEPLSVARLKAKPNTSICVQCLEQSGDVALTKKYDDYIGDDVLPVFFRHANAYLQKRLDRLVAATSGYHFMSGEEFA